MLNQQTRFGLDGRRHFDFAPGNDENSAIDQDPGNEQRRGGSVTLKKQRQSIQEKLDARVPCIGCSRRGADLK